MLSWDCFRSVAEARIHLGPTPEWVLTSTLPSSTRDPSRLWAIVGGE